MPKDKDSVLTDDDFLDLPDGMINLDPEPEVDDDAGLPFQLFDSEDDDADDGKGQPSDDDADGTEDGEEEDDEAPAAADAERASLLSQLSELQQKLDAADEENFKTQSESRKHVATAVSVALESLTSREEALYDKLKRARDDGEPGDEAAIQRQIDQVGHIRKSLEDVKTNAEKEVERPKKAETQDTTGSTVKGRSKLAAQWQAQNSAWMNDPKRRAHIAYLQELDKELASSGFNPQTENYFKELTKRLSKTFPDLGVRHLDGKAPATGQRQRGGTGKGSPVAAVKQSAGTKGQNGNKIKIDQNDLRMMRSLKLDTSNKDVLREFAKNKANKTPYMRG